MGIVPSTRLGKIEFYEGHIAPWTTNAVAVGLTVPAVTLLSTATIEAREAYDALLAARTAAKAATQNFYNKVLAMHSAPGSGADMIKTIKAFAQSTNNPNVYTLAQIPPPAAPGVTPPPGTPTDFTVGLLGSGALELKWKCPNPAGTMGTVYEVKRSLGGGPLAYIGSTGVRSFTDDTLTAGAAPVTYQITAIRSTARGNPAQFLVNFGTGGGGGDMGLTVTALAPEGVKLAA